MKITDDKLDELLKDKKTRSQYKTFEFRGEKQETVKKKSLQYRRFAVIAVAALLGAGLIALGAVIAAKTANHDVQTPPDMTETTAGAKTNPAETTSETKTNPKEKITYTYSSLGSTDRLPKTLQNQLDLPQKGYYEEYGYAVCIITALKIDRSGCPTESGLSPVTGKRVPIEIRIDKILSKNPAFTLKEGDANVVGEFAAWFKTDDGYSISIRDDVIPITEEGAQYVVLLYSADGSFQRDWWEDIEYMAEPLTIPVSEDGTYDRSLYDDMKLALDVRECSDDFIKEYFPTAKAK